MSSFVASLSIHPTWIDNDYTDPDFLRRMRSQAHLKSTESDLEGRSYIVI